MPGGVGGHVGPRLVDHPDHPERHPHLAQLEPVGQGAPAHAPRRPGRAAPRRRAAPAAMAASRSSVEPEPVDDVGRRAAVLGAGRRPRRWPRAPRRRGRAARRPSRAAPRPWSRGWPGPARTTPRGRAGRGRGRRWLVGHGVGSTGPAVRPEAAILPDVRSPIRSVVRARRLDAATASPSGGDVHARTPATAGPGHGVPRSRRSSVRTAAIGETASVEPRRRRLSVGRQTEAPGARRSGGRDRSNRPSVATLTRHRCHPRSTTMPAVRTVRRAAAPRGLRRPGPRRSTGTSGADAMVSGGPATALAGTQRHLQALQLGMEVSGRMSDTRRRVGAINAGAAASLRLADRRLACSVHDRGPGARRGRAASTPARQRRSTGASSAWTSAGVRWAASGLARRPDRPTRTGGRARPVLDGPRSAPSCDRPGPRALSAVVEARVARGTVLMIATAASTATPLRRRRRRRGALDLEPGTDGTRSIAASNAPVARGGRLSDNLDPRTRASAQAVSARCVDAAAVVHDVDHDDRAPHAAAERPAARRADAATDRLRRTGDLVELAVPSATWSAARKEPDDGRDRLPRQHRPATSRLRSDRGLASRRQVRIVPGVLPQHDRLGAPPAWAPAFELSTCPRSCAVTVAGSGDSPTSDPARRRPALGLTPRGRGPRSARTRSTPAPSSESLDATLRLSPCAW